jgi:hypothetical protein
LFCKKRLRTLASVDGVPSPNTAPINTKLLGYFNRLVPLIQQGQGMMSSAFQFLWASLCSHNLSPAQGIGHYL